MTTLIIMLNTTTWFSMTNTASLMWRSLRTFWSCRRKTSSFYYFRHKSSFLGSSIVITTCTKTLPIDGSVNFLPKPFFRFPIKYWNRNCPSWTNRSWITFCWKFITSSFSWWKAILRIIPTISSIMLSTIQTSSKNS